MKSKDPFTRHVDDLPGSPQWADGNQSLLCTCANREEHEMSKVRVLAGTRKGAFILTSDGKRQKWEVSGPDLGGWEIYHIKGSSTDPNRLYASQSSGWFGQQRQRLNDGGKTGEAGRN